MRAFRFIQSLSILMAVTPGTVDAAQRIHPIHAERRSMPSTQRRDEVLSDLNSILTEPASPTEIATTPHASNTNGLCQRDVIQLEYARKKNGSDFASVRPFGVRSVHPEYHLLGSEDTGDWHSWKKACARLAGKDVYWASSQGEQVAASSLAALDQAIADVRTNKSIAIDCKELRDLEVESRCTSEFLSATRRISWAAQCSDQAGECYLFGSSDCEITLTRVYSTTQSGGISTTIKMESAAIIVT